MDGLDGKTEREPGAMEKVAVRCTRSWSQWLAGFAAWCDVDGSELIGQSIRRHAEEIGYPVAPPARLGRGASQRRQGTPGRTLATAPVESLRELTARQLRDAAGRSEPWALRILARHVPPIADVEPADDRHGPGLTEEELLEFFDWLRRRTEAGQDWTTGPVPTAHCPHCRARVYFHLSGTYLSPSVTLHSVNFRKSRPLTWWEGQKTADAVPAGPGPRPGSPPPLA